MRRMFVALVAAAVVVGCSTSPTGRRQLQFMPEEQMSEMGVAAFQQMKQQMPVSQNTTTNRYVECVASSITAVLEEERDWEVQVFEEKSANAFALPGGKIGVHTGLLDVAKNQDQLAAVIGHEIGHVMADHSNERVSTSFAANAGIQLAAALSGTQGEQQQMLMGLLGLGAQVGVLLPFSRTQESESDQIGLNLMAKAGFDPRASVALWENMEAQGGGQPPEFLSTHPSHGSRTQHLNEHMAEAMQLYQQAQAQGRRPKCG